MSVQEQAVEKNVGWFRHHLVPRLRALFNLVLNIEYLIKTKDFGAWLASWLTYLGIVGATLTAIIVGATRGVIYAANTVLRPHALPIISPALERMFISWPQLAIGMGFHAHIITALYFAAPAYTAALIMAAIGDERLKKFLFPRGLNAKDVADHLFLWAVFITAGIVGVAAPALASRGVLAAGWQLLAPHIALGVLWLIYSLSARGLAYRFIGLALTLVFALIFNMLPKEVFADLRQDPWAGIMLQGYPA